MGLLEPPLQISCVMGVIGGIRPTARNLAHMAEQVPEGVAHEWGVIGISRDQWTLVAAALTLGRQRARRPGGQLLPARRRDGALQRRPRRAGAADGRGRRAAAGDGRRGAASGWDCERGARRHPRARPLAAAAGRLLLGAAGRLRRRRAQGRGHGVGDYVRWAPPHYEGAEESAGSALFLALNRNKRSIRINLKSEERARGAAAARARVRRAGGGVPARRDGPPRRRLRAAARGEPRARLLRDHRLRAGRPLPRPLRPRHELPRPRRAARADRRARRAAGAGRGPDRRPRRRRADGRGRDPGGAARARALGRGPARRRLDGRRRAVVARDGRGADAGRGRRAAARRARAGRRARVLPALPLQRRLGDAGRARAEVLAGVLPRRRPRGPDRAPARPERVRDAARGRGDLREPHARRVGGVRGRARLLPGAGAGPRRGARLGARARARDGGRDRPARRRAPGAAARRPGQALAHAGRPARAPGPALGQDTEAVLAALGYAAEEIAGLVESGAVAGPAGASVRGSFMG